MEHSTKCADSTHPCFACKLKYMRSGAGLAVSVPVGWKGPSRFQQERDHVAELKDAGVSFDRAPR